MEELLGHRSVRATMTYKHVLNRGGHWMQSPREHAEAVTPRPEFGPTLGKAPLGNGLLPWAKTTPQLRLDDTQVLRY